MKNRFWVLALISISFTGCYTSFAPKDYEEDSYGQMDNYYYDSSDVAMYEDSSDFYYPEEEFYYDDPVQQVTVINNYGTDWGWGYSPFYQNAYTSYGYYNPFYDPYYAPYCYPYYGPYYGHGYGSIYIGYGYGSGSYNYPSSVRYRTNRSHWTSFRNNGGRALVTRSRDANRGGTPNNDIRTRDEFRKIKGFDLDRDLKVSKVASSSRSINKSGLRTAGYSRDSDSRKKVKRTTDLERRRISNKSKNNEVIQESKDRRTHGVAKRSRIDNNNRSNSKRSKRVYSSKRDSKSNNSSKTSSRTYYKPRNKSGKSSNVSNSSRGRKSNSSGYSSSRSGRSKSSSYSSSRNTSRSSSSRSSVSRSSGSSSSRSSVSRSSGSSSSRSSGNRSSSSSRKSSGSSSRRR